MAISYSFQELLWHKDRPKVGLTKYLFLKKYEQKSIINNNTTTQGCSTNYKQRPSKKSKNSAKKDSHKQDKKLERRKLITWEKKKILTIVTWKHLTTIDSAGVTWRNTTGQNWHENEEGCNRATPRISTHQTHFKDEICGTSWHIPWCSVQNAVGPHWLLSPHRCLHDFMSHVAWTRCCAHLFFKLISSAETKLECISCDFLWMVALL